MKLLLILISLSLYGCKTTPENHYQHVLSEQILKPRKGFEGFLTNRACLKYEKGDCLNESIVKYDLSDSEFRRAVNEFNFICKIGGKRYKICLDKAGFCRFEGHKKCWLFFCKTEMKEIYVPVAQYEFLIQAKTRCYSYKKYTHLF